MIRELLTREGFDEAVRKGGPIVITGKAKSARFHPSAQSCEHVMLDGFMEKVLVNGGKNGGYVSVDSRAEAEQRCRRSAPTSTSSTLTCGSRT